MLAKRQSSKSGDANTQRLPSDTCESGREVNKRGNNSRGHISEIDPVEISKVRKQAHVSKSISVPYQISVSRDHGTMRKHRLTISCLSKFP